jgi:mRNA interferase MazF
VGPFVKGDVVVLPFPFSDLTAAKRRPALVIASLPGRDVLLCQITSRAFTDRDAISLVDSDFTSGRLNHPSNIRPNRIFTADSGIILYRVGAISSTKLQEVIEKIVEILGR